MRNIIQSTLGQHHWPTQLAVTGRVRVKLTPKSKPIQAEISNPNLPFKSRKPDANLRKTSNPVEINARGFNVEIAHDKLGNKVVLTHRNFLNEARAASSGPFSLLRQKPVSDWPAALLSPNQNLLTRPLMVAPPPGENSLVKALTNRPSTTYFAGRLSKTEFKLAIAADKMGIGTPVLIDECAWVPSQAGSESGYGVIAFNKTIQGADPMFNLYAQQDGAAARFAILTSYSTNLAKFHTLGFARGDQGINAFSVQKAKALLPPAIGPKTIASSGGINYLRFDISKLVVMAREHFSEAGKTIGEQKAFALHLLRHYERTFINNVRGNSENGELSTTSHVVLAIVRQEIQKLLLRN
jgi:hypothetical protein